MGYFPLFTLVRGRTLDSYNSHVSQLGLHSHSLFSLYLRVCPLFFSSGYFIIPFCSCNLLTPLYIVSSFEMFGLNFISVWDPDLIQPRKRRSVVAKSKRMRNFKEGVFDKDLKQVVFLRVKKLVMEHYRGQRICVLLLIFLPLYSYSRDYFSKQFLCNLINVLHHIFKYMVSVLNHTWPC